MVETYGVARQTVQQALKELKTEGLTVSRPGCGTFVKTKTDRPSWPVDWAQRVAGTACTMCRTDRPEEDDFGIRIRTGSVTESTLQRLDIQPGYTLVIWTGPHIVEPTELTDDKAATYWADVATTARALSSYYQPLKMNYLTLGNTTPHLHTHLIPRFTDDPAPGEPFPLTAHTTGKIPMHPERLRREAAALREIMPD
jgi:diadenosine tetraphosphate (Ap4A) HIT family hydrolase